MPRYTFACPTCGEVFERRLSFHDDLNAVTCPQGHPEVHRVYQAPAVVFKGSGFYITDHGRNGRNGGSKNKKEKANGSGTPSSEAKSTKAKEKAGV